MRFTLYEAPTGGSAVAGPVTNAPTGVSNGLFTTALDFGASDDESGVKSLTATLDGQATVAGHDLSNGQTINLLTDLLPGEHTFAATAVDNATNTGSASATFAIVVTPASIMDDVRIFLPNGAPTLGEGTSLLKKLQAAAAYRAAGDCLDASATYQASINKLMAQSGKKVTPTAAAIMIADARYLIAHCP